MGHCHSHLNLEDRQVVCSKLMSRKLKFVGIDFIVQKIAFSACAELFQVCRMLYWMHSVVPLPDQDGNR